MDNCELSSGSSFRRFPPRSGAAPPLTEEPTETQGTGERGRRTRLCCRCRQTEISRCSQANFMPIIFNVWELFSIFTKSVTNLQSKMETDVCARRESRSLSLSHVTSSSLPRICRLHILNITQQSEMFLKRLCSSAWVLLYYTKPNVKSVSSKSHEMQYIRVMAWNTLNWILLRFGVFFSINTIIF